MRIRYQAITNQKNTDTIIKIWEKKLITSSERWNTKPFEWTSKRDSKYIK